MADNSSFNGVIVFGRGQDDLPPVIGSAWDNDPNSSTYYLGPMGKVPYMLISEDLPREGQHIEHAEYEANELARATLLTILEANNE